MIPQQILQDEYLDVRINPADLGFCCIYLGGSAAYGTSIEHVVPSGSDWDGLGFVHTREDLFRLMSTYKAQLLQMLKVDYIDGSDESWQVSLFLLNSHPFLLMRNPKSHSPDADLHNTVCHQQPRMGCHIYIWLDSRWLKPCYEDLVARTLGDHHT